MDLTSLPTRDAKTLVLLGSFRLLSARQLADLATSDEPLTPASRAAVVQRSLHRLTQAGLVSRLGALAPAPAAAPSVRAYLLTAAGRRLARGLLPGLPRRSARPLSATAAHALLVADLAVALRHAVGLHPGARLVRWSCDWQVVERLGTAALIPDALVVIDIGRTRRYVFLEADRATEWARAFERKLQRYLGLYTAGRWRASLPVWPLALTVTTTAHRASALAQITTRALGPAGDAEMTEHFWFTTVADFVNGPGALAPIWRVAGRDEPASLVPVSDTAR